MTVQYNKFLKMNLKCLKTHQRTDNLNKTFSFYVGGGKNQVTYLSFRKIKIFNYTYKRKETKIP